MTLPHFFFGGGEGRIKEAANANIYTYKYQFEEFPLDNALFRLVLI